MILDVVGIGSQLGMDFIETPEGIKEFPGGSTANSLVTLQSLGLKTGYIGLVGSDKYAGKISRDFIADGIDISRLRTIESPTPVCRIKILKGERTLSKSGEREKLEDFPDEDKIYIKNASSVLARVSYPLTEQHAIFAKQSGLKVFLSLHSANPKTDFGFLENIDFDVLFANEAETKVIKSVDNLIARGAEVVVTKGRKGCSIYTGSGRKDFPAYRVTPIDSTGAGDAFAAGYVYGYLSDWDLERRARFANAMGAMATRQYGGRLRVKPEDVFEFIRVAEV